MPRNNGKARKVWRRARANERAHFTHLYFEELLPKARKLVEASPGLNLAKATLAVLNKDERWVPYDDPRRVFSHAPRPN